MVINHLVNGMILQVGNHPLFEDAGKTWQNDFQSITTFMTDQIKLSSIPAKLFLHSIIYVGLLQGILGMKITRLQNGLNINYLSHGPFSSHITRITKTGRLK